VIRGLACLPPQTKRKRGRRKEDAILCRWFETLFHQTVTKKTYWIKTVLSRDVDVQMTLMGRTEVSAQKHMRFFLVRKHYLFKPTPFHSFQPDGPQHFDYQTWGLSECALHIKSGTRFLLNNTKKYTLNG
jgi:hypothetical protein